MTETVPEWLWVWRPSGLQWDDIVSASQCYRPGDGREVVKYVPATALEAAQARIETLEEEKRASLLGVIAMVLSCGGELRVNPKARQSCQQYNLHAHNDPETGDIVLSARALMEKSNDQP